MKLDLEVFKTKYSRLSDIEFEKAVLDANKLNPELIDVLINEAKKRKKDYQILNTLAKKYKQKGFPQYFNQIEKNDIKDYLTFLKSKLPNKPTKNNYQLTPNKLVIKTDSSNNIQVRLQKVSDLMRSHLNIKEPIKILTLDNIDAGKFEMIDNLNCIYISTLTHQNILLIKKQLF